MHHPWRYTIIYEGQESFGSQVLGCLNCLEHSSVIVDIFWSVKLLIQFEIY